MAFQSSASEERTYDPESGIELQRSNSSHKREGTEHFIMTGPFGELTLAAQLSGRPPEPKDNEFLPGVQNVLKWTVKRIVFRDGHRETPSAQLLDAIRAAFQSYAGFYGSGHPAIVTVEFDLDTPVL